MAYNEMTADKIWDYIEGEHVCIFATQDTDLIRTRPMAPIVKRKEECIWFFTDRSSKKINDLGDEGPVTLNFQNAASNWYISTMGSASVVDDQHKINELWSPMMEAWFDDAEDPRIVLIAFKPEEVDYWDGPNRLIAGMKMLASAVTGNKADMGEAGTLKM
jgi:general stress protein 26